MTNVRIAAPGGRGSPPDPTVARLRAWSGRWTWRLREVPVLPRTVEVLGSYWPEAYVWEGLDFANAVVRERSPISGHPLHHLAVPWMHPDDRADMADDPDAWCIYRVYPAREGWRFHRRQDGIWVLRAAATLI